jgi:hypothetical protein
MKKIFVFFIGLFFLFSCGSSHDENIPQEEIEKVITISNYAPIILERGGLKLIEFNDFPPFNDVETKIATQNQTFKMGSNKIEFKNRFFNLGEKTVEENIHRARLNEGGQYLGTPRATVASA